MKMGGGARPLCDEHHGRNPSGISRLSAERIWWRPHDRSDPVLGKNEGRYILDAQGNKTLPPRQKTTTNGPFTEKEPIRNPH